MDSDLLGKGKVVTETEWTLSPDGGQPCGLSSPSL